MFGLTKPSFLKSVNASDRVSGVEIEIRMYLKCSNHCKVVVSLKKLSSGGTERFSRKTVVVYCKCSLLLEIRFLFFLKVFTTADNKLLSTSNLGLVYHRNR